ncbi:MAG: DUF3568 family protein [Candidatus Omnitrophota bacterium]
MFKRIAGIIAAGIFAVNIYGCFALFAGAAGGVGTSAWLGGKLTQEVNAPYEGAVRASKSALKSMNLEITKESAEKNITQIKAKYYDEKTIWVDIRPVTENSSKIEIRVGAVNGDKEASDKILKRIQGYL